MQDYSLIDKLKILAGIISSSPLFLSCFSIGIAALVFYIISIKKELKINKWIFISIWLVLLLILLIGYSGIILSIIDNLFNIIFETLYFPSLASYIIILIVSNFMFIYSIISKKTNIKYKILNFVNALIINLFLILIVDIVKNNNINVYEKLTVYSNSNLLVLLELTTALFTSWILIYLLFKAHDKLKVYDKEKNKEAPLKEIIFEKI